MYPPLMLERLAEQHQRTLLDEATHERLAAALVGYDRPWWKPIAISLRHLAIARVSQVAVADHA
jgi:hypothetical protein